MNRKILRAVVRLVLGLPMVLTTLSGAAEENILVTKIEGAPIVLRGSEKIQAAVGTSCQKGDILKTAENCVLDVSMNNLAGCRLLPSTACAIEGAGKDAMSLHIQSGNAVLNLEKLPQGSTFRVETPTAVASVRGTQFWGRVDLKQAENPVTTFAVRDGIVEVLAKAAGKTFKLEKGQALDIPKDGAAPLVRPALTEEMAAMEQAPSIKTSA